MGMPSMPELLIVLAIVVLLFGAKKIPDLAKGMGKGIKDFKKAIKEDDDEVVEVASKDDVKIEEKTTKAAPTATVEETVEVKEETKA
jgi:sec-independent protein translocase protein TatA